MKIGTFLAGAGLALTLSALPPAAFAQAPAGNMSSSMNSSNAVSENNPNASAGASNTTSNEVAPQDKAHQVKNDLDTARQQGENVSTARRQYRLGMRTMEKGENSKALQHFEEAENDISAQQSNTSSGATGGDNVPSGNPASGNSNNLPGGNTSNNY
jgi:hypothetical protein